MYCPQCGARKEHDEITCSICGHATPSQPGSRQCPACHEPIGDDDLFCAACGARVSPATSDELDAEGLAVEGELAVDLDELPEWLREFAHEQGEGEDAAERGDATPTWLAATRAERVEDMGAATAHAPDPRDDEAGSDEPELLQLIDERDLPEWLRELEAEEPAATASSEPGTSLQVTPPPAVRRAWLQPQSVEAEREAAAAFEPLSPVLAQVALEPAGTAAESAAEPVAAATPVQHAQVNWLRRILLLLVLVVILLLVVYMVTLSR